MTARSIAPSLSPNEEACSAALLDRVVILGVEHDERIEGFNAALSSAGLPSAVLLDYRRFVEKPSRLPGLFPGGTGVLRIESPGGGAEVVRALSRFTAAGLPPAPPLAGTADRDARRIGQQQAFQCGLDAAIRLACTLVPHGVVAMNDPAAVALFYDKRACHAFMLARGFPVPCALPPARSFDELVEAMRQAGLSRVFVKPRWGSGGAGIAALAVSPAGLMAMSSAELAECNGKPILYHSSHIRRYEGHAAISLVNAILALDAHVERWVPRAAVAGQICDLRILVVAGEVAHTLLRTSPTPLTNLDLGARRADAALLREKVGARVWEAMLDDCRRFAGHFPKCFHVAFDVGVLVDLKRHVFFEVNAFGDLLRRVRHQGLDPYEWQIARFPAWAAGRQVSGAVR